MEIEIRPCREDEFDTYDEIVNYVFASPPRDPSQPPSPIPRSWNMCGFVDGAMAATLGAFPFIMRFNGKTVRAAGVTQVGTLPHQRRKGLLRTIMTRSFESWREEGQPFAILWASMGAIYQRFGYGLASTQVSYSFDPREAGLVDDSDPGGSVSLESPDSALATIDDIYRTWSKPRTLALHRTRVFWDADTLRKQPGKPRYVAISRDGEGTPDGHLVYATSHIEPTPGSDGGQLMTVHDFIAHSPEATRRLWRYIRGHDLVRQVVIWNAVAEDSPLPHLLLEPRSLHQRLGDGIWLRVVDIENGLPQRGYDDEGRLTFQVAGDSLCPWNEGTYELETGDGEGRVTRTERTADIVLPPRSLASLVSGHSTATHLARCGLLEATSDAALRSADRLFATAYRPHCPNGF